jgi:pyridoxal phosphate enzyme (YggS family)
MLVENLNKIKNSIPEKVKLVAVSKTKPTEDILESYNAGHKIFGENKVQELTDKYELLPKDIDWHFIGHLQTNKVKYIAPFVSLLHGVDSLKLLKTINKEANKNSRSIDVLLQIHIAQEESKFGFTKEECIELIENPELSELKNIRICGLMGMATNTKNDTQIRKEFSYLAAIFSEFKNRFFQDKETFKEISMGMSGDYNIAIEEGSTMIRVGSLIFGERNYKK